jgi:hypothetical protein
MDFMFVMVLLFIVGAFILFSWWSNKRKVANHHICFIVTKSRDLVVGLYPKAEGQIKVPPNKLFKDNSDKSLIYLFERPNALRCTYPLLPSFLSKLTAVDAWCSWYEEGDPRPLVPSDIPVIDTPKRLGIMQGSNVAGQIMRNIRDSLNPEGSSMGFNLGKYKLIILIMIAIIVIAILISAYASIQALGFIPYAKEWMTLR